MAFHGIALLGVLLSLAVLSASGYSFWSLARQGRLDGAYLRRRGWLDAYLLLVWTVLLISSLGLFRMQRWAAAGLLLSLRGVLAWALLSALLRLWTIRQLAQELPVRWRSPVAAHALVLVVIGGVLFAASRYFHDPAVQRMLR